MSVAAHWIECDRFCLGSTYSLLEGNELLLSVDEVKNKRVGSREDPVHRARRKGNVSLGSRVASQWSGREHLQAEEESEAGQVHVALRVELSCGVVGLGSNILYASVVTSGLAFAHHLDHALNGIDEEDSDEATGTRRGSNQTSSLESVQRHTHTYCG